MCVGVHMCMCAGVSEDRKIASDHNHLELELQAYGPSDMDAGT